LVAAPEGTSGYAQTDGGLDQGGRILGAMVRPYAAKVAGEPLRTSWDPLTGVFELDFVPVASTRAKESEIFIPNMLLHGQPLDVRGLSEKARDRWVHQEQVQTLFVVHGDAEVDRVVRLSVHFGRPISPPFKLSLFRENLMTIVQAVFLLMLSVSVLVVVAK
jgi:hypothetical protein